VGKVTGFLEYEREDPTKRPAAERVKDWREFELPVVEDNLRAQGARCMDCGIPFCNTGCPLGNLIPDWNDHVFRNRPAEAIESLHATNNFPEFTGRVCPAPCEAACVLTINSDAVSIKLIERSIADRAFAEGHVVPMPPRMRTGKKVAVIGSGPAGMAAAQQLNRAGHTVTLFEKDDRIGGLLTYGIPDFKMEKWLVERRVEQMREEGVVFKTGVYVGKDLSAADLKAQFDAICLTIGSRVPRDLPSPGRELDGIHYAMDFLTQQNQRVAGDEVPDAGAILASGKDVVVIGGGDTGSDCIGTSHRQGAKSVTSFEILPRPPDEPHSSTPWPMWPLMLRTSSSHEEGGARDFGIMTKRALPAKDDPTRLGGLEVVRIELKGGKLVELPGTEEVIPADLVLLAMGFVGPITDGVVTQLGCALDARGNVAVKNGGHTSVPGVFAAGDMARGQSLVVWAIAEGRKVAAAVDAWLAASEVHAATARRA